jgi:hypothetical protein
MNLLCAPTGDLFSGREPQPGKIRRLKVILSGLLTGDATGVKLLMRSRRSNRTEGIYVSGYTR